MEKIPEQSKTGADLLNELAQKRIMPSRPRNETDKRYVLSREQFSVDRIKAVKDQVMEMKSKHPEFLSMCMFGSMVKGTAHDKSDIDGVIFVDSEVIAREKGVSEEELVQYNDKGLIELSVDIAREYALEMRNGIKEKTGLSDEYVADIKTFPISEGVINRDISKSISYYEAKDKYEIDNDNWNRTAPERGSSADELIQHQKSKPIRPEYAKTDLGQMFNLDVGGGIKKYRTLLINKLQGLGVQGERIWTDLIETAEFYENGTGSTQRYPRTLEGAVKLYG